MRRTIIAAALLTVAACTPSLSTGTAGDEQAIRDATARWSEAWNKGDAGAMAALVLDDYQSFDDRGNPVQGRPAFESAMAAQFASRPAGMTMTITTGFVKWLSSTSAVAGGGWSLTGPDSAIVARGKWLSAYQKKGGAWLVASGLGSTETPISPMASDTARGHT